jgi:hypothetical protein
MANRKSMRGVEIDLAKLMARQEKNITIGNTKTNARGDQLGKGGRIVKSADELAREHYNRNDPKAVVQGGIKADDDTPEIRQTRVEEVEKPVEDDWQEPVSEPTPEPTKEPEPKAVKEDDPWVEDEEGNFVRQSELNQQEQNERVSKPTSKNKQPKKK